MFSSLRAQPLYNPLLLTAVELLLEHSVDLRVFHIAREDNIVADALSCFRFDIISMHAPLLRISQFLPPRLMLGAVSL
jgi:hypothetical protein